MIGWFEILLITTAILEFNPLLQSIKIIRLKEVRNVSVWTYVMIFVIGVLWLIYGFQIASLPLIVANIIKVLASLSVIIIYIVFLIKKKQNS